MSGALAPRSPRVPVRAGTRVVAVLGPRHPAVLCALDRDSDGFVDVAGDCGSICDDCDDSDASINPAANEVCDGVDNNCDGKTDVDLEDFPLVGAPTLYADLDGDGYGAGDGVVHCEEAGWSTWTRTVTTA